jgi:hypothetical protein
MSRSIHSMGGQTCRPTSASPAAPAPLDAVRAHTPLQPTPALVRPRTHKCLPARTHTLHQVPPPQQPLPHSWLFGCLACVGELVWWTRVRRRWVGAWRLRQWRLTAGAGGRAAQQCHLCGGDGACGAYGGRKSMKSK